MGETMETRKLKLSLVEWCIVVGIVGVVGASVRPGLSQAMEDRKLPELVVRLHEVRSAIALYKIDHAGLYPGQQVHGDAVDAAAFWRALTTLGIDGRKAYVSSPAANPFVGDPALARRVECVNDPNARPDFEADAGWWFNAATGQFCALSSAFHAAY